MNNETKLLMRPLQKELFFCDCNEDFILPDYMPEIRRILRLTTKVLPDEPIMSAGAADVEGRLVYQLLYTNEEGTLTEAPLESRFQGKIPLDGTPVKTFFTDVTADSVSLRPTGPRKVNIRTKLCIRPHAYAEEEVQPPLSRLMPEGIGNTEVLYRQKNALKVFSVTSEDCKAQADLHIEGCDPGTLAVLVSRTHILPETAKAENGHVSAAGMLLVRLLIQNGEDVPRAYDKKIPFETEIPAEDCKEGDAITLSARVNGMEICLEEGENAADLLIDLSYTVTAHGRRNEVCTYIRDLYSVDQPHEIKTASLTVPSFVGSYLGNLTLDGEDSADSEVADILDAVVSLKEARSGLKGDRVMMEGSMRADLLVLDKNGDFDNRSFTFPFSFDLSVGASVSEHDQIAFCLTPLMAEGRYVGNHAAVTVDVSVFLSVTAEEVETIPMLAMPKGEGYDAKKDLLQIYYPTDKDSLWSIGKAYAVPLSLIKRQNGMPDESDTAADSVKSIDGYPWLFVSTC